MKREEIDEILDTNEEVEAYFSFSDTTDDERKEDLFCQAISRNIHLKKQLGIYTDMMLHESAYHRWYAQPYCYFALIIINVFCWAILGFL